MKFVSQKIILASQSPQRKKILSELGIDFEVIPSGFEEIVPQNPDPYILAKEFALEKARDVSRKRPQEWVLGVDTIVITEEEKILFKPVDEEDARGILDLISKSKQTVVSGIALVNGEKEFVYDDRTDVYFRELSKEDKDKWIQSGLWQGRSGGFQIDGPGGFFVKKIEGDFYNVVGLPVYRFGKMLELIED